MPKNVYVNAPSKVECLLAEFLGRFSASAPEGILPLGVLVADAHRKQIGYMHFPLTTIDHPDDEQCLEILRKWLRDIGWEMVNHPEHFIYSQKTFEEREKK